MAQERGARDVARPWAHPGTRPRTYLDEVWFISGVERARGPFRWLAISEKDFVATVSRKQHPPMLGGGFHHLMEKEVGWHAEGLILHREGAQDGVAQPSRARSDDSQRKAQVLCGIAGVVLVLRIWDQSTKCQDLERL